MTEMKASSGAVKGHAKAEYEVSDQNTIGRKAGERGSGERDTGML